MSTTPPTPRRLSEAEFQRQVLQLATLASWLHYHTANSRGSDAGFPDLVLVRAGAVLFVELKADNGQLTPAQETWLARLRAAGAEVHVWRPSDWPAIEPRLLPPMTAGQ